MITISIDPIIFGIGHFALRWYSLILLLAIGVGIWLTAREAERKGFKKEDIYDVAVWIIIGELIGARLFHVLDHWSHEYAANPIRALYIWEGGLAIWGAMIAALLLGVLESFFAVYVSYDYRDAFGLLILILVLIFRPQGLIGEKGRDV